MIYFTLFENANPGGTYISPVKITKMEDGYYNVKETTALLNLSSPTSVPQVGQSAKENFDANQKRITKVDHMFKKVSGVKITKIEQVKPSDAKVVYTSASFNSESLNKMYPPDKNDKCGDADQATRLANDFDCRPLARWLVIAPDVAPPANVGGQRRSALTYLEHKSKKWTVIRKSYFVAARTLSEAEKQWKKDKKARFTYESSFTNSTKNKLYIVNATGIPTKGAVIYNSSERRASHGGTWGSVEDLYVDKKRAEPENKNKTYYYGDIPLGEFLWLVENEYTVQIEPEGSNNNQILAIVGDFEVGSVHTGTNVGTKYCFYSKDYGASSLSYVPYFSTGLPYVVSKDSSLIHSCTSHGGDPHSHDVVPQYTDKGTTEDAQKKLVYNPYKNRITSNGGKVGTGVKHLEFGTRGTYKDGVATLPYVMIELRGTDTATGKYKSLSLPANNFISLTHKRSMGDSYNTFQLQIFDQNALQVESWLLMGFRYITFWYTDYVSTSKRFKGEILDYKTTIAGKGLMLTLTGYTSNADIYTGKDSVPWSKICEAKSFSFYYWLSYAGEYHGEVRLINGDLKVREYDKDGKEDNDLDKNVAIYNSVEGTLISPDNLKYVLGGNPNLFSNAEYCLRAPFTYIKGEGDEESQETKTHWVKYRYYYRKADPSDLDNYEPKARIWSLDKYGYDLGATLNQFSVGYMTEPRPSNIVILIAIICGWKVKTDYIKTTRTVTEIPDQVSQSFIEYIKECLIPISMSDDDQGITQYNLWFDDEGYVHYAPMDFDTPKTIYFNSKQEPDTYPLISYTASSNGSVLMKVNASQSLQSINVFTGDEINATQINNIADQGELLKQAHVMDEWFATSQLTLQNKLGLPNKVSFENNNLVTYANNSVFPSEDDLLKNLKYRYGLVSKYSYEASIDVYGCSDISPGQLVNVYIYLGDGARSDEANSKETTQGDTGYVGNTTMHHSSGTYIVNSITDTISGGRYISTLNVLKLDAGQLSNIMGDISKMKSYSDLVDDPVPGEGTVGPNNPSIFNPDAAKDFKDQVY